MDEKTIHPTQDEMKRLAVDFLARGDTCAQALVGLMSEVKLRSYRSGYVRGYNNGHEDAKSE